MGKQVAETLRAVAGSDELRAVRSELTTSMKRVSAKVLDAVKTAGKSERPKAVAHQLGKVAETSRKRGLEAGERLRTNLSKGLREIGQELLRPVCRECGPGAIRQEAPEPERLSVETPLRQIKCARGRRLHGHDRVAGPRQPGRAVSLPAAGP